MAEIELTEDEFEERLVHAGRSGQSAGLHEAAEFLMKQAEQAFRKNDDMVAKNYRAFATHLKCLADERHPGPPTW